jgi:hypothetical protein
LDLQNGYEPVIFTWKPDISALQVPNHAVHMSYQLFDFDLRGFNAEVK